MAELSLADMAAVWRRDLVTNVIPFWEKHSLDREHGGYFTCCDRDGKILDDSKYMWLQARAVFMWSRLHNEFVDATDVEPWFAAAKLGADFLRFGKDADGRLYFAVSRDGATPLHFQRKPYAAVFYTLAALEYAEALRRRGADAEAARWLDEAVVYFGKLREWIDAPHTLGRPPVAASGAAAYSSLADVMCMASLAEELLAKLPAQRDRWLAEIKASQAAEAAAADIS